MHVTYLKLVSFSNSHHHVYCDNYFSSVRLFCDLERNGIYACGTLRTNRKGFPEDMKKFSKKTYKFKERGDNEIRQHNNLTVTLWQDNKVVCMLATNGDPTKIETVRRKIKDLIIPSPQAIVLYNKFMGGVDRNDQLHGYYLVRLKGRKFYMYIFWFLLDLGITNGFILCKHHTYLGVTTVKEFRSKLAKALVGSYCSRKRPGRPSTTLTLTKFQLFEHYPTRGAEKAHRCHLCHSLIKRRRETVWRCMTCKKFLCHTGDENNCYLKYHLLNKQ